MPDTGALAGVPVLQALLAFSGAVLAPAIGAIVALLSRSEIQKRQQEAEYNIKRLELIEKSINVGKSLSNSMGISVDISTAQAEFFKVMNALSEPEPPSEQDRMPFEKYRLPMRWFLAPRPMSISGWIASILFYMYLVAGFIMIPLSFLHELRNGRGLFLIQIIFSFLIAFVARFWAIRAAKAAIRRARERFQRETVLDPTESILQKS